MNARSVTNEPQTTAATNPIIEQLIPFMNPEVIEAESLYDLIDEDMNFPDWS